MSDANELLSESLESNESSFTNSNTDLLLIFEWHASLKRRMNYETNLMTIFRKLNG